MSNRSRIADLIATATFRLSGRAVETHKQEVLRHLDRDNIILLAREQMNVDNFRLNIEPDGYYVAHKARGLMDTWEVMWGPYDTAVDARRYIADTVSATSKDQFIVVMLELPKPTPHLQLTERDKDILRAVLSGRATAEEGSPAGDVIKYVVEQWVSDER